MGEVDRLFHAHLGYAFAAYYVADFYVGVAAGVLFGAGPFELYAVALDGGAAFGEDLVCQPTRQQKDAYTGHAVGPYEQDLRRSHYTL